MSMLDLLNTIGHAPSGTRATVTGNFLNAVDAINGGTINLPTGTEIEITGAMGVSISAVAEINGALHSVYLFLRHYPLLKLN